ncbi:hypothetical protein C8J57DRAFT_1248037 [Mycena rebaudengoi]|nr:hypothetical protein C8J57DRAFT_1248037 [Mycena rebaudengoi]
MPILIKCTSKAGANAALDLHKIFKKNNHLQADHQPEVFARALVESLQFQTCLQHQAHFMCSDVETQVHGYMWAKFHWFDTIKDTIIYMVLKGDIEKMQMLGLLDSPIAGSTKTTNNTPSHIRDFTGIIDTIYGITTNAPTYPKQNIGRHAGILAQTYPEYTLSIF